MKARGGLQGRLTDSAFVRGGTTSQILFEKLRDDIVNGKIVGGQALKQAQLAEQFGVSKIPVREALRQLESSGFVEFRPRRGAVVVSLTAEDILDMLDVRIALECRAIKLAVPNFSQKDFDAAAAILSKYESSNNPVQWGKLNRRFHQCLYQPCGRRHLLKYIADLQNKMGQFMHLHVSMASGLDRPHKEHIKILQACLTTNAPLAVKLLRNHIKTTQKEVATYLQAPLSG